MLWACGTMVGMAARAAVVVVVVVAVAAVVLACRCVRACSTVARRGVSVVHVAVLPPSHLPLGPFTERSRSQK